MNIIEVNLSQDDESDLKSAVLAILNKLHQIDKSNNPMVMISEEGKWTCEKD